MYQVVQFRVTFALPFKFTWDLYKLRHNDFFLIERIQNFFDLLCGEDQILNLTNKDFEVNLLIPLLLIKILSFLFFPQISADQIFTCIY